MGATIVDPRISVDETPRLCAFSPLARSPSLAFFLLGRLALAIDLPRYCLGDRLEFLGPLRVIDTPRDHRRVLRLIAAVERTHRGSVRVLHIQQCVRLGRALLPVSPDRKIAWRLSCALDLLPLSIRIFHLGGYCHVAIFCGVSRTGARVLDLAFRRPLLLCR